MQDDFTWDALAKAHGVDPGRVDDYAKRAVGATKRRTRTRALRPVMNWPDRIPTADAMLDTIAERGGRVCFIEYVIFLAWLGYDASDRGRLAEVGLGVEEFERRYYGENAPERITED